jgi:glycolate oxidase iron-sulfur subunit
MSSQSHPTCPKAEKKTDPLAPPASDWIRYDALLECIHCGICLSTCPTFDLLGTEADSPRGRIYLMRALAEGRTEVNPDLVRHLDGCLACRACETACPSSVHYGELLAQTRDHIHRQGGRSVAERAKLKLLLDTLAHPKRMALAMKAAQAAARVAGEDVPRLLSRFLTGKDGRLPLDRGASFLPTPLPIRTPPRGETRARVGVIPGCVMSVLFQQINHATVRVLAANGCEVIAPSATGCCGSLHMHNGFLDAARGHARQVIQIFQRREVDAIVVNSAGCGSAMKEYGELFAGDRIWESRARAFAAKVRDLSEFLIELGPRPPEQPLPLRVAYHDACHLAHGQRVREQPRALLASIPGLSLVELTESDWCCGSAGIYNLTQPELASRLQERKVENVLASGAECVVTANPGCHTWIEAGLRDRGHAIPVKHIAELLDEGYRVAPPSTASSASTGRRRGETHPADPG